MRAPITSYVVTTLISVGLIAGCEATRTRSPELRVSRQSLGIADRDRQEFATVSSSSRVQQVAYQQLDDGGEKAPLPSAVDMLVVDESAPLPEQLVRLDPNLLISEAMEQNPRLVRLYREYQAAAARSQYVDKLPDPKLSANIFGDPIETAAGSQRATMSFSQTIPWLRRLNAQQQRQCFEAFAVRAEYDAERLRVVAGIRVGCYRLYVIDKQIEKAEANQELLASLVDVANARIATGKASQGDVLLGTLELSKLEERILTFRKQRRAMEAEINRLVGRPIETPISAIQELPLGIIKREVDVVQQAAFEAQPEIEAARLRAQATRWGIEVARLSRRPEFMLSASYFFTDNNRPASPVVNVGEDPWAIGVQVSLPIWRQKYDAMRNEAGWQHQAAHASVEDLAGRYDALILDLMAEAQRAIDTANLYTETILPQARQTLSADQESYSNGNVEFDRVIRDYRNLLTLELGYYQAVGDLAIANARLQQAAGHDLEITNAVRPLTRRE